MKILITGHCGFIGQNFVKLYKNNNIYGIDKLTYASNKDALFECNGIIGDICNDNDLDMIFQYGPFDLVINFAAESHVDNSINCPDPFIKSNILGTYNLLEYCRKRGIGRFIQIGTDEVFGDLDVNDPPFNNDYLIKPSSPYSASKASADMLVQAYHRTYKMDVVITRSCNNYGPFQFEEKLIPVVIKNALTNHSIPLYGDGMNMREWIWVEDNCQGIMAAALNGKSGECYNLGSGIEFTNKYVIKTIINQLNKPQSLIKYVEDRKGHDKRYFLDSSKSYKELSWKPLMEFNEGIKRTIKYYENYFTSNKR